MEFQQYISFFQPQHKSKNENMAIGKRNLSIKENKSIKEVGTRGCLVPSRKKKSFTPMGKLN
jgi:hypothetical protein